MHIPINEVVEIIHYGVPKEPERKNNKLVFTRVRFLLVLSLISCIVAISGVIIMGIKLYHDGMLHISLNVFCLGFFLFFLVLSFLGLMSYRNSRIEYYPNGFFYCYNTWGTRRFFSAQDINKTWSDSRGNLHLKLQNGPDMVIDAYFKGFHYLKEMLL